MISQQFLLQQTELTPTQIRELITQKQQTLSQYLGTYQSQPAILRITTQKILTFRHNYQTIISMLNKSHKNINNHSMHLLITLSLYYRALHMHPQNKEILKKTLTYIGNAHSDAILQGICLNHLASYYKGRGKDWKCLKYALKGVEIVQVLLHQKQRPKKEKQEVAILMVVLLIYAKNCSKRIMKVRHSKALKQHFEIINYLGYKTCVKYLGKDSIFNQFDATEDYFHLPVFRKQEVKEPQEQKESGKQAEIINQLTMICQVLKSKKNPEFVVINTQSHMSQPKFAELNQSEHSIFINNQINEVIIQQNEKRVPSISKIEPAPKPQKAQQKEEQPKVENIIQQLFKPLVPMKQEEPVFQVPKITINQQPAQKQPSFHYVPSQEQEASDSEEQLPPLVMAQETMSVNKWQIKFRLQKERDQRIGNLVIECSNKRHTNRQVLSQQKLQKITCQINKEDKFSYQIINEELYEQQFIEHYIKPFFSINQLGMPALHPRSNGLIQPYQIKFLNQDSLVFLNHIRHNLFRIAISPSYSCKSLYLNVELSQATMVEYFTFQEETIDFINAIFKSINNAPSASIPPTIKDKTRLCKVINQLELLKYINQVIAEFQNSLLTRQDQTAVNEIIENQLVYYKYQEIKKNRLGIYYFIRYLPSINYFDIYLKNNYETYSIDSKIKSRGNALYKAQDFLQDFGIPLKASKKNLFAYIEIIAKKYYLLTFDKPLTQNDNDRYVENAILELPITENCFKTRLVPRNGYFTLVTISLLTINSETPVGIKIIQYDPITCKNRGFFIHIVSNQWVRPYRKPAITINNILFNTYINQFPFRSEYFLPEWLQKNGFSTLFDKIMDPLSPLYLQHNINRLVRGKILIKIFNNQDST